MYVSYTVWSIEEDPPFGGGQRGPVSKREEWGCEGQCLGSALCRQ